MVKKLVSQYGAIFEEALLNDIIKYGLFKNIEEGEELIDINQTITHMPLLLEGAIKIIRENKDGSELVLYFIEKGDTCAMIFNSLLGNSKSNIRAVAETPVELILIPVLNIKHWLSLYDGWQSFVFQSFNSRFNELLEAIDTIAFRQLDERLLKYLQDKAKAVNTSLLQVTHKGLSEDMNTSRVVISRVLKKLEHEGKIKLNRNQIQLLAL